MPFDDLINLIEMLKRRIEAHRQSLQQNEIRTRTALIGPLLTALGWDVAEPGLVTPEYSVGQGRADYALINGGPETGPVAIVEAKSLGNFLNDRERNQMLNYANMEGIEYAILTNGDVWELYDIFKRVRLDERRLLSVKIASTPAHQLALQLLLLWRPNLASGVPVPAQEPVWGTRRETTTTEAFHPPVETPLPQTGDSAPPSVVTHQPKQQRSSGSFKAHYCVDGKTWRECSNATALMLSIVAWCGQQHRDGSDNYYEKLSHTCLRGDRPILVKERVTEIAEKWYSGKEVNGWYIFNNLTNSAKKEMIEEILRTCIRQNSTSPILGQDIQVKMPND